MSGDLQASRGQQPHEPTRCTCGCLDTFHKLDGRVRGACSNSACGCRRFTAMSKCVRCQTADADGLCCSSHDALLCHRCYRRTHFVEICGVACSRCAREGLDPTKPAPRLDQDGGS